MSWSDLKFSETDARAIQNRLHRLYEEIRRAAGDQGYRLADAAPERLVQLAEASALTQVGNDIDYTGKSNLLFFADDTTIDYIGGLYGERGKRLEASYALTTMRYTLAVTRTVKTLIPEGSRTTPDNKVFFATTRAVEIMPGELSADVEAKAMTPGLVGMGWEAGEINNMVVINPFVVSAVNITPTSGGGDGEALEPYRARIRMLPESFSTAGPDHGYEFWARTANPGIVDVRAWMPELDMDVFAAFLAPWGVTDAAGFYEALYNYFRESHTGPGNVNVAVLMREGEMPSEEVKEQVFETISSRTRRPLTDFVHVKSPEPVDYEIELKYWISLDRATEAQSIIDNIEAAVGRFILFQRSSLGVDIVPSFLVQLIMEAGAKRVEIVKPDFIVLKPYEVGIIVGEPIVTFEGLEVP
jgi:phage-related baseplate assembly protein